MTLRFVEGDATRPEGAGHKIIVHVCNDVGGWGKGFVLALSKRWPNPEQAYFEWYSQRDDNDFGLGAVQLVDVEDDIAVANLIGQQGLRPTEAGPPIRYPAIAAGLGLIRQRCKERSATVHMPRMGAGLAGGRWEEVEALIQRELVDHGISVTVYDLPQ